MADVHARPGPPIGALHEVHASFADPDALQEAVERLELSGFDRADLSLPEVAPQAAQATPEAGARAVDDERDARQVRTLQTSGAAAAAGVAAAGVVIATGGAVVPAVAAAVIGGGLAGGAAFALSSASNASEQEDRERKAASGTLVLSVRAETTEKRAEAVAILRASGASEIELHHEGSMTTREEQESYDRTIEDSFPASDPPASSGVTGPGRR